MTLAQRLMKPKAGERVEVYKNGKLLIRGLVTHATSNLISITNKDMGVANFSPTELDEAIANRTIRIKKLDKQKQTGNLDRSL